METIITRDTDTLREYLAVLDSRARELSPFARLAATMKLAQLRQELSAVQLEATDEDVGSLLREITERLNRSRVRKFEARPWGARISIFLMSVLGQQLPLALVLLLTMIFVQFAPSPKWWNPLLPHEEPIFLYMFIFVFLAAAPLLALAVLFGGRYFKSWRKTVPATLVIVAFAMVGTALVVRGKMNPVQRSSSLNLFCKERGVNRVSYDEWLDANWLMKDPKFRSDYERYLRNGPGRWITARFNALDDAAWVDSMRYMAEYLDGGQDPKSFRDWLKYYLDRNRIYSEDRIEQEVNAITGEANERFLGVWQVEPYLKERDERSYRSYIGSVNRSMKLWELLGLALSALVFLLVYLLAPAPSALQGIAGRLKAARGIESRSSTGAVSRSRYSFPEQPEITTPPFFDTPFKMLSRVHRSFVRRAVLTSIFVFAFWAAVYALDFSSGHENLPSQLDLMKGYLLVSGPEDSVAEVSADLVEPSGVGAQTGDGQKFLALQSPTYLGFTEGILSADRSGQESGSGSSVLAGRSGLSREALLAARVAELERRLDDAEYDGARKLKEQARLLSSTRADIDFLKNVTSQLRALPEQVTELGSRATAAESRSEAIASDVSTAKQQAEGIDKKITSKLGDVEARAARAAEQAGKVEERSSLLATRTEALEKELDRRAGQIEARTEELGERTAELKEREQSLGRLQQVTFATILSDLKSEADDLDRRTRSSFYRFFYKGEGRRDADSLRQRIFQLTAELGKMGTGQAKKLIEQLEEIAKQVEKSAARLR